MKNLTDEKVWKYEEVKQAAKETPLLRKATRIGDVKIIDTTHIEIKGNVLELSDFAFNSLIKLFNIPLSFQNRVENSFGPAAKLHLLNTMKDAMSVRKNEQIMLIGNTKSGKIVSAGAENGMLSNDSFFDLVESVINKHGLELGSCSIGDFGDVTIITKSTRDASIKGLDSSHKTDEGFTPGLAFVNSVVRGTQLNPYTMRLVCSNGMIAPDQSSIISIKGFDSKEVRKFYEQINKLAHNNFVSGNYNEQVLKAVNTYASLAEIEFASKMMHNASGADLRRIDQFVPYLKMVEKFDSKGFKLKDMSSQQMKNAQTNVKLWDVVNGMTNFATHKHDGIKMDSGSRVRVQGQAGALLNKKTFDTANLVPSLVG